MDRQTIRDVDRVRHLDGSGGGLPGLGLSCRWLLDVEVTGLDSEAHWRLDDVRGNSAVSKGPQALQLTSTNGDLGGFPTFKPTLSKTPTEVPTAAPSSLPSSKPSYVPTPVPTTSVPTSAPSRVPSPSPSTAVPTKVPVPRPTALPTAFPSWDNCNRFLRRPFVTSADPSTPSTRGRRRLAVSTRRRRLPFHAIDAPSSEPRLDVPPTQVTYPARSTGPRYTDTTRRSRVWPTRCRKPS